MKYIRKTHSPIFVKWQGVCFDQPNFNFQEMILATCEKCLKVFPDMVLYV